MSEYVALPTIINANANAIPLKNEIIQTVITSPPYWGMRDYGIENQLGLEPTPEAYVKKMVQVFREVWRVLKPNGTVWLNLGDSYTGRDIETLKPKDLVGIPWRVAFALQADGWWLRSDIIWSKPNPMPESVQDRPTNAHEYLFLLTKSSKYYYDAEAIWEVAEYDGRNDTEMKGSDKYLNNVLPGQNEHTFAQRSHERWPNKKNGKPMRNKRDVWTVKAKPYPGEHFAVFPPELIHPCILAGSKPGDYILDPFNGKGTTIEESYNLRRRGIGLDLKYKYCQLAKKEIGAQLLLDI